jgi:hypothetical protein
MHRSATWPGCYLAMSGFWFQLAPCGAISVQMKLMIENMVDERGFEPPASSLRKHVGELDGVKADEKD